MSALDNLKNHLRNELITKRAELKISQEEMAERLDISTRCYSDLEHGVNFCSALSLINFVNNCDVDANKLFSDFADVMKNTEN